MGQKTQAIEVETGCSVSIISKKAKNKPVYIKLCQRPSHRNADLMRAREMIEDSLLEFVECDGAKARLLYELAALLDGNGSPDIEQFAESGIVQQRDFRTNDMAWMRLVDLPTFENNDFLSFKEDLRHRMQQPGECSVEVFIQGDNLKLPVTLCKPFALICAKCSDDLVNAAQWVEDSVQECQQRLQSDKMTAIMSAKSNVLAGSDHTISFDENDSHRTSLKRIDKHGILPENEHSFQPKHQQQAGQQVTCCILTIPFWVRGSAHKNLFCKFFQL